MYSIRIYSWFVSLIHMIERWCRNFMWSADIHKIKLVTMVYKECCNDYNSGGSGLRSIRIINEATNLEQCRSILNASDSWGSILKARVSRHGRYVRYHMLSSI